MILTFTPNPCVDKTVFISTLTPGEKIRSQKCTCIPGGKGNNVSRAVKALGYDTASMVIVGGRPGQHVVDMIEQQDGVRCIPLWVNGMTRTINTVLEEPIHRQTAFFEPGSPVTAEEMEQIVQTFTQTIIEARVVTFNGGIPDPMLHPLYERLIGIAKEAGVITILDSYGPEFTQGLEAVPYMIKPNQQEAELFAGFSLDTDAARWRAIDAFHNKGIPLVVMSLGKEGALVSREDGRFRLIPPEIKEINPVGSGDALVAGFAIGLQENWPLERMARLGVAAGTANAMSWDIGHFTREEVDNLVAQVQLQKIA
ncbi:MAG TPA: 1-phosphofructokinase family hexose kinase [Candidatus Hydrogenedentes bacterium]|nr:1-phosphofructokinase family hexose kinase [Candidatus Hydrogenedentota bacterium]